MRDVVLPVSKGIVQHTVGVKKALEHHGENHRHEGNSTNSNGLLCSLFGVVRAVVTYG